MVYVDASAIVKLVIAEAESVALAGWIGDRDLVSSAIAGVEVRRAVRLARLGEAGRDQGAIARALTRASDVLGRVTMLTLEDRILDHAADLEPATLRSIDAIHLATALTLRTPEAFVTYDRRLADAARGAGLTVHNPGA